MLNHTMRSLPARILWSAIFVIAVIALLKVFNRETQVTPPAPVPSLREVPARELTSRDGRAHWRNEAEPFAGFVVENYPDGSLKSRSLVSNGVMHGVSEGWHANGILQVREHFENGISHGVRTKWFDSGMRLSEATIEMGKIVGLFRRWHENGLLAEEIQMTDNVPDGISRAFYPSGAPKAEARLDRGKVVEQKYWNENEVPVVAASGGGQ